VSRRPAEASTKRWAEPLLRLLLGFAFLAAFWVAGNSAAGLGPFAIMLAYVVLLLVGGRSEIVRVLRGQPADERYRMFNLCASAITGTVTLSILTGEFFYELARGHNGNPDLDRVWHDISPGLFEPRLEQAVYRREPEDLRADGP